MAVKYTVKTDLRARDATSPKLKAVKRSARAARKAMAGVSHAAILRETEDLH
ncbi:MAG: hypothetical protein ACU0DW_13710 [Shimia sp.]